MAIERVNDIDEWVRGAEARRSLAPRMDRLPETPPAHRLVHLLRRLVLRFHADVMLHRALRPHGPIRLDELSPYLLRDIGLPPDYRG